MSPTRWVTFFTAGRRSLRRLLLLGVAEHFDQRIWQAGRTPPGTGRVGVCSLLACSPWGQ